MTCANPFPELSAADVKLSIRSLLRAFRQMQGTPTALARGTAVGVFVGVAPLMPLKSLIIVAVTVPARSSTAAALLVCTLLCNPITYLPLYYLAWLAGDFLLPGRLDWAGLRAVVDQMQQVSLIEAFRLACGVGFDAGMVLLAGGCVLALPLAAISYPLAVRFFRKIERARCDKHLLRNQDPKAIS